MKNLTKNFHREPFAQRIEKLSKILPNLDTKILQNGGLSIELADNMIENCIGTMPLPLGLGIGFKINGKNFIVPMAIEEPSVIAAASSIAKLIAERGSGFLCISTP
jgi:degradative hydroxymethylglutaryl-CoA reductase